MKITLEVAVQSPECARAAVGAGADRLELSSALELGGLTPSLGLLRAVRDVVPDAIPIVALVRPRSGGFIYDNVEWAAVVQDARALIDAGAAAVAVGALRLAGESSDIVEFDEFRMREVVNAIGGESVVCHRAFDCVSQLETALDRLIDWGVARVLTSGGAADAPSGAETLRTLLARAEGRIEVLAGSGLRAENLAGFLSASGCNQIHGTFSTASDRGDHADPVCDARRLRVDPKAVQAARALG